MKYRVIREIAKVTTACAGMEGYDSEVTIEVWDGEKYIGDYYVSANAFDGEVFSLSKTSFFEFATNLSDENPGEVEFIEQYESYEDTQKSEYAKVFEIAKRLLDDLTTF